MPMKFQNILYNRLYEHLNANTFVSQCTYLYEESEDRAFNVRAHSDSRAEYLALAHSSAFFPPFILRVHLASSHTLIFLFSLDLRFFFVVFFAHRVRLVSPLSISKRQIVSQSFLLQFNEIIRTTRSTASCCLFPSCGWRLAIESAPFRVTWPLKHRRKEFYVRPGARALRCLRQARARARLFFLGVCHRDADLSLSVFLIAARCSRSVWGLIEIRLLRSDAFAFFGPFRGFDFRSCKIRPTFCRPPLFVAFFRIDHRLTA